MIIKRINVRRMPWIPRMAPPIINIKRYILSAVINSGSTNIRDEIDVMAIIIIIIGETIPALTAASPKIRAPTIDIAELAKLGSFRSLSLNISNAMVIKRASKKAENGTFSLCAAMLTISSVGSISWLYVVIAMYSPGVIKVIIKVRYLIILVIVTLILLL